MSKKKTKGRSGVGTFFLGSFIGFILCIALIVGAGFFAYYKVSADWINKTFKTELDLGNDEINNKTIGELITGAVGIVQNLDTYTLENLKKDFGIEVKDELMGIKINDLKTVSLQDLPDAIEKKFGTISADELRNVNGMNLEKEMGDILDKTVTYYFDGSKLYESYDEDAEPEYSKEVGFDYSLNTTENIVTVKGKDFSIVDGKVAIELWYLPLTSAIGDYTSNLGSNMTLRELKEDYNVKLPDYIMKEENLDKTINEFTDIVDGLYIADVLEYSIDKSQDTTVNQTDKSKWIVKDKEENVVSGAIKEIAKLKIGEVSTGMQTTIDGMLIADVLEYSIDKSNDTTVDKSDSSKWIVKDRSDNIVNGIVKEFAIMNIEEISTDMQTTINDMYVAEVLEYTIDKSNDTTANKTDDSKWIVKNKSGVEVIGVEAELAKMKIGEISTDLQSTINDMVIADVMDYQAKPDGFYEDQNNDGIYETKVTGIMATIAGFKIGEMNAEINKLTIANIMDYSFVDANANESIDDGEVVYIEKGNNNTYDEGVDEVVTGVMAKIAGTKVDEFETIQNKIDTMSIADVLEYTINADGTVVDKDGRPVSGVLAKIADLEIGNMSSGIQTKIDTMTIAEVLNYTESTGANKFYFKDANNNGVYDSGEEIVTGVMSTLASANINNVSEKVPEIKLKDALNYSYDEDGEFYFEDKNGNGTYQDGEDSKITGIMATLAGLKVSEISNKVNTLKIGDALGYYYDETDQKFYQDSSKTPITGILSAFVDLTIQDLNESTLKTQVNKLTIADVFENTSSGMLSLIPSTTKLGDIVAVMNEKMKTVTLGEFVDNNVIELSETAAEQYEAIKDKPITLNLHETVTVKELKVSYVMELTINNLYDMLINS